MSCVILGQSLCPTEPQLGSNLVFLNSGCTVDSPEELWRVINVLESIWKGYWHQNCSEVAFEVLQRILMQNYF